MGIKKSNSSRTRREKLDELEKAFISLIQMKEIEKKLRKEEKLQTLQPNRYTIIQTTRIGYFTDLDNNICRR